MNPEPLPPSIWAWCPGMNEAGGPCRVVAEVQGETMMESTSGPVRHLWVQCAIKHHRYFLPAEMVVLMD